MSAYQISLPSVPVHIALSPSTDSLVTLFNDGSYRVFGLHTRIPRAGSRGGGAIANPQDQRQGRLELDNGEWRQVLLSGNGEVFALATQSNGQDVLIGDSGYSEKIQGFAGKLTCGPDGEAIVITEDGKISSSTGERKYPHHFRMHR
jgi:hypothetical protein